LRSKTLLRESAVIIFYLAIAMGLTWPMARHLQSAVPDLGDPLLTSWILDWVGHGLTHQPLRLYDAPIFHPSRLPLAYSENLIAVGLLVLPFQIAGASAVALNNIALLLGFALSGYGAFVLARMISGSTAGALVAGVLFAFAPYKFDHISHLQIVFSAWVPLLLAALLAFRERATWKRGALLTLVIVLHGLTNIYFLLFCGVACAITVLLLAVIAPRDVRFYIRLGSAVILAGLILLPFLLPYRVVSKHYQMVRHESEARAYAASWIDWLVPSGRSRAWSEYVTPGLWGAERQLFPGLMMAALAVVALAWRRERRERAEWARHDPVDDDTASPRDPSARSRARALDGLLTLLIVAALAMAWISTIGDRYTFADEALMLAFVLALLRFAGALRAAAERSRFPIGAWAAAVWIMVGVLGSFGPKAFFYEFFYRHFEPFQAMRGPARFAVIAYAGLAVWAAIGAATLVGRTRWRHVIATLLVLLAIYEVIPKIRWERAPVAATPVHRWLARERVGPLLELPVTGHAIEFRYLLGSAHHHVPTVNGVSGFWPPESLAAIDAESRGAYDELLALMEKWNVKTLVIHGDWILPERRDAVAAFVRTQLAAKRIAFLGRFDNGVEGDYLFAITRNLRDWPRLCAAEVPDAAGHLPRHQLERFLNRQTTHSNAIVIVVEDPTPHLEAFRTLLVKGWALSPHGIRRATIEIGLGKRRFDAQLVPRDDVKRAYPWAVLNATPGFEITIPKRPKGVPRFTTIAVEIEDHAGRVRRSHDIPVTWQ
jgi:hypothetical protein